MAIDVQNFITPEQSFEGVYRAADTMERQAYRKNQLAQQREGRIAATGKFLTDYLDPKDRLTGTNYDPEIVRQLNDALVEGADLARKGAGASDIIMALGPKVGKINEYSQKAKLINKQIIDATSKLKGYKGYNTDAILEEAKKLAFYGEDGKLRDIKDVDPDKDWVTEIVTKRPEVVTTGAGIDEFVSKVPMKEYGNEVQTMVAGRKLNRKYDAKSPFYMGVQMDAEGNAIGDKNGNPVGLEVMGDEITDDKGKPMLNPDTGKPYKALNKAAFDAIMMHNPDVADFVRGRVNQKFKEEGGGKIPAEGSAQWELMARRLLRDELGTRDRSSFKLRDLEIKSAPLTRIELGIPFGGGKGSGGSGEVDVNDIYKRVDDKLNANLAKGFNGTRFNALANDEQEAIKKSIEIAGFEVEEGGSNIFLRKDGGGNIKVYKVSDDGKLIASPKNEITTLSYTGTNLPKQANTKGKVETVRRGQSGSSVTPPPKQKNDPLGIL